MGQFWLLRAKTKFDYIQSTGELSGHFQDFLFFDICPDFTAADVKIRKTETPLDLNLKF